MEETENTVPGHTVVEATTTKKNLEGWSLAASGMEGRATRVPRDMYWAQSFGAGPGSPPPPTNPRVLSDCRPQLATGQGPACLRVGPCFSRNPAHQLLLLPPASSSHQHRHPAGEKHAKEPGGKGKKNRNLKIGKITVSEKWRESVFRKITNANELKYLDEFLLNKVGRPGATMGLGAHAG